MSDRHSEDISRRRSHPDVIGASGVATADVAPQAPPGGWAGGESRDPRIWREAGPAAGLVARRWALEILRVLDERGPTRFNDLRRATGAAGQPLNATLDALARAGLISRRVVSSRLPRSVVYSLTPSAYELFPVLSSLATWHQGGGDRAGPGD